VTGEVNSVARHRRARSRPTATGDNNFQCLPGNAVAKERRAPSTDLFCGAVHIARHVVSQKLRLIFKTQGRVLTMARITSASLLVGGWLAFMAGAACAQTPATAEMRSLDEQVQEIKTDVLGIASELNRL